MPSNYVLPKSSEVLNSFGMLYGNNLDVSDSTAKPLSDNKVYGLFVDPEGKPVAATMCDAPFAAFAGSAMMMLPPGGAEDAAESGELTEAMTENVYELINICSRMFMTDDTPHLKLEKMYTDESELPEDAKAMINACEDTKGFGIDFPRYGSGNISFVTT